MPPFRVVFKPSVERDLRRLPADAVHRVFTAASRLAENPFPRGAIKLKGAERFYRIRVGAYRIIYEAYTR
ncbi:MAG TPA: type II toxin-antitoxin system RelE/ParE family toxin [Thermoplasmata archaeon]|nr:type II toxin-antitoxin system RelE/ParE family toxin [Thermoplasmata archaeon]